MGGIRGRKLVTLFGFTGPTPPSSEVGIAGSRVGWDGINK